MNFKIINENLLNWWSFTELCIILILGLIIRIVFVNNVCLMKHVAGVYNKNVIHEMW